MICRRRDCLQPSPGRHLPIVTDQLRTPRHRRHARPVRYGVTLLLSMMLVGWILAGPNSMRWESFGSVLLATLTLESAMWAAGMSGRKVRIGAGIVLIANVLMAATGYDTPAGNYLRSIVLLVTAVAAPILILRSLIRHRRVDLQLLLGAITVYLQVGIFFFAAYAVVARLSSTPILRDATGLTDGTADDQLYFSFVTLSTTGYGDLTPAHGMTRALALLEALGGQLYLVVAVAAIVSLLVSRTGQQERSDA